MMLTSKAPLSAPKNIPHSLLERLSTPRFFSSRLRSVKRASINKAINSSMKESMEISVSARDAEIFDVASLRISSQKSLI